MTRPKTIREQADRLFALLRHAARFYGSGLLIVALGCAAALVVAVKQPRVYRSEALILYRQRISDAALGHDDASEGARRIGLRLREVVLSRSRLERIINEMKLYPDLVDDRGMAEAVDLMRQKVGFKAREGDTYALSFEGNDPIMTQKVTQRLTDILKAENERSAVEVAAGTKEFLDAESERVDEELKKRESRLAKFLAEHPAFAAEAARTSGGGMMGVSTPEAPAKKAAGGGGRRRSSDPRIEALEREAERIQARLSPGPPPSPSLSPEAKEAADEWNRRKAEATRELEAAQRDLQDKRQSFTDEHPDVKRSKGRVEAALRVLDEVQLKGMREVARMQGKAPPVLQPLTADDRQRLQDELIKIQTDVGKFRAGARRSADTDREAPAVVSSAASVADNIVKLETTWVQLNREVTETREQKNQVEARRFTADIRERLTQSEGADRMVVIDPPYKPSRPVRGGRTQTAGIGGMIALALALGIMLLRALLDDRVYDRYDIDRLELMPLLTAVPPLSSRQRRAQGVALPRPGGGAGALKKGDRKANRKAAHG